MRTAGCLGPATLDVLHQLLGAMAADPAALLVAATDADRAGQSYAEWLAATAAKAAFQYSRLLPPDSAKDWNDALRRG